MTSYSRRVRSTTGETIYEHHNRVWAKHGIDWDKYEQHGCAGILDSKDWYYFVKTRKVWMKGLDFFECLGNKTLSLDDLGPRSKALYMYSPKYAHYMKGEWLDGEWMEGSREHFQRAIASMLETKDNTEVEIKWYEEEKAKHNAVVKARIEKQQAERAERDNKSRF